jgi:hypothetical protein
MEVLEMEDLSQSEKDQGAVLGSTHIDPNSKSEIDMEKESINIPVDHSKKDKNVTKQTRKKVEKKNITEIDETQTELESIDIRSGEESSETELYPDVPREEPVIISDALRQSFDKYVHHNTPVYVRKDLKGHHREYCLCYHCENLDIEDVEKNCPIANVLYRFNILAGITTPVWECKEFKEAGIKK